LLDHEKGVLVDRAPKPVDGGANGSWMGDDKEAREVQIFRREDELPAHALPVVEARSRRSLGLYRREQAARNKCRADRRAVCRQESSPRKLHQRSPSLRVGRHDTPEVDWDSRQTRRVLEAVDLA